MADTPASPSKAPWHLWVVGVVSLLWNAIGSLDFTMAQLKNEAYLKSLTVEQREYIFSFPLWAVVVWGVATWGSLLGSVLLLLRRKLAVPVNLVVLICMLLTFTHNFLLSDGLRIMGGGIRALVFPAVIAVICVLLYLYARAMARRGVLR